ncbi:MAG: sigma-70 family RNA polymerase sigma factor [Clostridia bacterium]|nr:sigma-70 family RNA polymerase sigma factor [Clostridia bacterium]
MKENTKFSDNIPLLVRSHAGDRRATEELVKKNGGLVAGIAARFRGRGTDYEDLVALGNLGLLKAIRTFDTERGCAFSTYAVPLIFGEIRRFLRDDGPIKVSRTQKRLGARLAAARDRRTALGEESIRIESLAEECGVTAAEAAAALESVTPVAYLSDNVYGDEDGITLEGTLYDDEEGERNLNRLAIAEVLGRLPELRRKIILLRYFRDMSQEETARALGLTQVKVSREEKRILAVFREALSD